MIRAILGREKGFTILEVVFAAGILAIGILGYTSLKVSNRYSWVFAKDLSQAVPFTVGQLEGLQMAGFNSMQLGNVVNPKSVGPSPGNYTAQQYEDDFGDTLGIGDLPVSNSGILTADELEWAKGVTSTDEKAFVDFRPDAVGWTVKAECPSELTKMITFKTWWWAGDEAKNLNDTRPNLSINQVQVRP